MKTININRGTAVSSNIRCGLVSTDDRQVAPGGRDALLRVLKLILFILLYPVASSTYGQIQQAWVARYNNGITNGTNQAVKMTLDSAANVYITGFSQNSASNLGYVTIKYAPNGNQLWATRYDSTNYPSATPTGLVLDNSNNVITTGSAMTVKYDFNGNQLWTAPYSGTALAVDPGANVYVTGFGTNFNTVKLNTAGSNEWFTRYVDVGPTLSQVVLVDGGTNIYIAGADTWVYFRGGYYVQLAIVKYDSNGNQLWVASNEQGPAASVRIEGAALDGANNLYLAADYDPYIEHYVTFMCSAGGSILWTAFDPTGDLYSQPHGLVVDTSANVIVTGDDAYDYPNTSYGTYKLNTNGAYVWTNLYPKSVVGISVATSIITDQADNCYVTGYSPGTKSGNDIVTIKYDQNGNQVWLQRYHGPGNGDDAGNAIAVDNNGNVYVTGYETTAAGGTEIVTIKYSPVTLQRRSDGTVLLQAQGTNGESFDFQASTDLMNWLDLGSVLADSNGLAQFADTNASNYNWRFYFTSPQ
jgi:hypothetical protein